MEKNKTTKEIRRAIKQQKRLKNLLIKIAIGLGIITILGFVVWFSYRPLGGEEFPIMAANHIEDNTPPGEYNSDPPTSGAHYSEGLTAGFYAESDLPQLPPYPDGHLVHNLEHGYIIFWYNCDNLEEDECSELKIQITSYMNSSTNKKLIAFPRRNLENSLVLTSWGSLLKLDDFDEELATEFIRRKRYNAPEPNAP